MLLLDEPTNDLDVETLRALEEALLDFPGCAVVISHDRWFLDRVATHILAFEGDSAATWFEGSCADYVEWVKETRGAEALEPHRIKYKPLVARVGHRMTGRRAAAGTAPRPNGRRDERLDEDVDLLDREGLGLDDLELADLRQRAERGGVVGILRRARRSPTAP